MQLLKTNFLVTTTSSWPILMAMALQSIPATQESYQSSVLCASGVDSFAPMRRSALGHLLPIDGRRKSLHVRNARRADAKSEPSLSGDNSRRTSPGSWRDALDDFGPLGS